MQCRHLVEKLFCKDVGMLCRHQDKQHYQKERIWQRFMTRSFSEEFINWLFQHLHKVYKETCSKDFINSVLEIECIKKLYSDMFQISQTDELPYETATVKLMWE